MAKIREGLFVANMIWSKAKYFDKHYIYPTQETWLRWLNNQGGLRLSRRTLNRWFARLESHGIFVRINRNRVVPGKGIKFASTLYALAFPGLYLLYQNGRISWSELKTYLKNSNPFKKRVKPRSPGQNSAFSNHLMDGVKSLSEVMGQVLARAV